MTPPSTTDRRGLIIVDVQNDFTEFMAVGDAVAYRIGAFLSRMRDRYAFVLTTQDWHIRPGEEHFKRFVHCVAGTPGADLDPELTRGAGREFTELVDVAIRKGQYAEDFSGFRGIDAGGKRLADILGDWGVTAIDVCGLAENGCVAATIRDGLDEGFKVRLLTDLSGATSPEAAIETEEELAAKGADVLESESAW